MNKESIDLGRLYRVPELVEICVVNYWTALLWVRYQEHLRGLAQDEELEQVLKSLKN